MTLFIERALFIVAPQDSGKSTVLRSMFLDRRLGTAGKPPSSSHKKLVNVYHLSNERRLYLRLTSPHENWESPEDFMTKTRDKMENKGSGRWCFAGPFQPNAFRNMPDVVTSVKLFIKEFGPERVRVAFLSPNRHGDTLADFMPGRDLTQELLGVRRVEVACLDCRKRGKNGLFLADFLDFT